MCCGKKHNRDSGDPRITYISYVCSPNSPAHHYIHPLQGTLSHQAHQYNQPSVPGMGENEKRIFLARMCLPWFLSPRSPSPSQSSSIMVSSSSTSLAGIRPSLMTGLLCPKGCESGQCECRPAMSLGRCEEGEAEKDGPALSREEPEDVDGESGGVGCRSLAWSNGHAMGRLKGQG